MIDWSRFREWPAQWAGPDPHLEIVYDPDDVEHPDGCPDESCECTGNPVPPVPDPEGGQ